MEHCLAYWISHCCLTHSDPNLTHYWKWCHSIAHTEVESPVCGQLNRYVHSRQGAWCRAKKKKPSYTCAKFPGALNAPKEPVSSGEPPTNGSKTCACSDGETKGKDCRLKITPTGIVILLESIVNKENSKVYLRMTTVMEKWPPKSYHC